MAFLYVGLVLFSLVYQGWHYATDGYGSIAVVAVGHFALRRLMNGTKPDGPGQAAVA